ncbi:MAG TPA: hypothetical protein VFZ33_16710 [Chitinophagaceae bacterium]
MIIVNFATKQYRNAQRRLMNSVQGKGLFISDYPPGWPTHQESPYEFKIHSIRQAMEIDPIVLWVDSSMYRVGDLTVIENIIKEDGYFFEQAGHYAGRWTNEHTRNYFMVTHDEMFQGEGGITMFSAGLLGLDATNPLAMDFFKQWEDSAKAGCFRGDWVNHRHDMTCASIIATRLGMKYQTGGTHLAYIGPGYSQPKPSVVFHCQGV